MPVTKQAEHGSAKVEEEVSLPLVAEHVCRNYEGMMVGLPAAEWLPFRELSAPDMAGCLRHWAAMLTSSWRLPHR